jgi:CelD/BcsL family acetyltransferase involved in cellulose biosynthesis
VLSREGQVSALRIDLVDRPDRLALLEPEWRRLFTNHGEGLPFRTWEWHQAWWKAFAASGTQVLDATRLLTFRSRSGDLVGIAPLMLTRRPGRGPFAVRVLDYVGTDPNVTEIRGPIVDPRFAEGFHAALRDYVLDTAHEWDWFRWRGIPHRSTGFVRSIPGVVFTRSLPAYTLTLSGTWEEFRSSRSRNLKESLRKCTNSLRRDRITAKLEVATCPPDVERGLDRFLELHRMRAEFRDSVPHPNVFGSPAACHFLRDVFARFAERGEARVFQLRIGDSIVASRLGIALGDSIYLYYSGYDPAWARYSVMTTTLAEAIRHSFSAGLRFVHLSTGTDVSKTRWDPVEQTFSDATLVSPTLKGSVMRRVFRGYQTDTLPGFLRRLAGRMAGRGWSSADW